MKNHMRFDVLTLFPQMFEAVLGDSIIGRARENNILEMNFIDIRDFQPINTERLTIIRIAAAVVCL